MQGTHHTGEFIGKNIKVSGANNKSLIGICGMIIDETKNTFKIKTVDGTFKTILKKGCLFSINGQNVDGKDILLRPEDRIKSRK